MTRQPTVENDVCRINVFSFADCRHESYDWADYIFGLPSGRLVSVFANSLTVGPVHRAETNFDRPRNSCLPNYNYNYNAL